MPGMRLVLSEPKRYEIWRRPACFRRRRKNHRPRSKQSSSSSLPRSDQEVFEVLRRSLEAARNAGDIAEVSLAVKVTAAAGLGITVGQLQNWLDSRTDEELARGILTPGRKN